MISNGALEYLRSARKLYDNPLTGTNPFWFCTFQSVELSLKSFLRGKGYTKEQLKSRKFGHQLSTLYSESKSLDLGNFIALTSDEEEIICVYGTMFGEKIFQYSEVGWGRLPYAGEALLVAENLYTAIRPFAEAQRTHHHGKPSAVSRKS